MTHIISRWSLSIIFILSICFLPFTHAAADTTPKSPIPLLQTLSDQMIQALKLHKSSMQKNPQEVYEIVHEILLPHADLEAMARSALGRDAWLKASQPQRTAFIDAFTHVIVHTYAAGLSSYTDEKVQFRPIRGGIQPGMSRVMVESQIIRDDGPPIEVDYRLVYKNFTWLVYDFSVEGISMIESFRSQFADKLSQMNIDQLTQELQHHTAMQRQK